DAACRPASGSRASYGGPHKFALQRLNAQVVRKSGATAHCVVHADVESAHSIPVGFKVLEVPRRRIDRGKKIDVNASRLSAVTSPPLHFWWDVNVDGDDRRLQARGEMERAFIKGADFASCDALAFRAEVYRITGAPQDTVGTAKDLAPPLRE